MKNVLVVGLGVSGRSAARFLLKRGTRVVGTDQNDRLIETNEEVKALCRDGMLLESEAIASDVSRFDQIVVSPGVPTTHPCYQRAIDLGIEVIGEVELACREIKCPCLAITGTNGKTTVTLMTEHVLQKAGIKAKALGNIGTPLTAGMEDVDVLVIELSSFQLETLKCRFVDAGVILNITPDHLDRYASMDEYAAAKIKLGDCLKLTGKLFVEERCFQEFRPLFGNKLVETYGYNSAIGSFLNKGPRSHDIENMMASYALCSQVGISQQQFLEGLSSFKKPAHRIEFIRIVDGIRYVDDSKGTNIDAVVRAVESIEGNIVLIAGGVDKGFPYTSWAKAFNGKVKAICAIGQSKQKIKNDLEKHVPVDLFDTLEDAVSHAAKKGCYGDTVLLSPGCSSFDMFKDYAHRGNEFQRIVNEF